MPSPLSDPPLPAAPASALACIGEHCERRLRYSREQIIAFAHLSGDANPLHHSTLAAQRARFGEVIASGQQTASQLMGLAASHFSRSDDGVAREALCLNFNFAFKAPVFAEQELVLRWCVTEITPNARRQGLVVQLQGDARVGGRVCVVGRGTLLLQPAAGPDGARCDHRPAPG